MTDQASDILREVLTVCLYNAIQGAVEAACADENADLPSPDAVGYIVSEILKDFAGRPSKVWIPSDMLRDASAAPPP